MLRQFRSLAIVAMLLCPSIMGLRERTLHVSWCSSPGVLCDILLIVVVLKNEMENIFKAGCPVVFKTMEKSWNSEKKHEFKCLFTKLFLLKLDIPLWLRNKHEILEDEWNFLLIIDWEIFFFKELIFFKHLTCLF